ncbi:hypothetical protein J522_3971 [Acinetobacter baumannii 146457]|nr:hypothetical protein J522_3971 [Acinetobacter baumannii 146457]
MCMTGLVDQATYQIKIVVDSSATTLTAGKLFSSSIHDV